MAARMVRGVLASLAAGAAGLAASRLARRGLRRAAPRLAAGPILGPLVFLLASRYVLPRVERAARDLVSRRSGAGAGQSAEATPATGTAAGMNWRS